MWADIALSFATSIVDAACVNLINKRKVKRIKDKLIEVVKATFGEFSDTSLDCNEFAELISGKVFLDLLRNYFFSIRDGLGRAQYMERFETFVCNYSSKLNPYEVRRFIKKIDELYDTYLHKIIEDNVELNAVIQIMTESHREILKKIVESEENLYKYISSLDKTNIKITDKDILEYHDICRKDYGKVRFTGISGAEDKAVQDIDEFYVKNTFSYYSQKYFDMFEHSVDEIEEIKLNNLFDCGNKIVMIGAAGLGKSTTLNYLFCNYEELYNVKGLKLKIDLKEYAKDIVEDKRDVLWCLATEFNKRIKRTKLTFEDVEKIISDRLNNGECLVILDALDEIPTQAMRNTVRDRINTFCDIYYLNRFIISTREVGYLRNKFDDIFLHIKINEFNPEQIREYSKNWYNMNYKQQFEFKDFWNKFESKVKESKCSNLIKNPIILILALVIFDIQKNLPNRRVEFYKKCIDTFLIVREDRKAAFNMTEKIKNILGDDLVVPKIAYYKYNRSNDDPGYKFTKSEVKNAIFEAIEVPDRINWTEPVNQYTSYLIDRTELIGEIDEDRFDFAHKTFFEYFLAVYYSRLLENCELVNLLKKWIGDSNNDELARLIIEVVIEKNDPRQHKYIIDFLFKQIEEDKNDVRIFYKGVDVFRIISDLYKNNMLLPRFHELYYDCLLFHPNLVDTVERMRFGDSSSAKVVYDSKILAQHFNSAIRDKNNFNVLVETLYRFDDEYKRQVFQITKDDRFKHITNLFRWIKNYIYSTQTKKIDFGDINEEVEYFLGEELDLTLSCPQIYISVVDIILLNKNYSFVSKMLNFNFETCHIFRRYTSPQVLYALEFVAFKNSELFLLFFILMIKCSQKDTNRLLMYILERNRDMKSLNKKKIKSCENVILFLKLLRQSENVEQFKDEIDKLSLYDNQYANIYEKLFKEYKEREQEIDEKRIEAWFKEYNSIETEEVIP